MSTDEATLTDFLRDPNTVVERLQHGDVVLHRRNAGDLRLSLESRSEAIVEGVGFLGRVLGAAMADAVVRRRLLAGTASIPWIVFLPERQRREFLSEFLRVAEASASVGAMAPLGQFLREWQATAATYADPDLAAELQRPLAGDGGPVHQPTLK